MWSEHWGPSIPMTFYAILNDVDVGGESVWCQKTGQAYLKPMAIVQRPSVISNFCKQNILNSRCVCELLIMVCQFTSLSVYWTWAHPIPSVSLAAHNTLLRHAQPITVAEQYWFAWACPTKYNLVWHSKNVLANIIFCSHYKLTQKSG